jgi:antitoxin component YwqK of YwqJK toxin-antitoxin module
MFNRLLSGLLLFPLFLSAKLIDTVPAEVLYFNDNFEIRHIQQASYYGIIERFENRHFKATLFTPAKLKVATVGYSGKDKSMREGLAVGYYPSGKTQFIVNFNRDVLDGEWRSYYENGQVCDSGAFFKNIPEGLWISYYENGQPKMIVNFNAKKLIQVKEEMRRLYRPTSPVLSASGTVTFKSAATLKGQQAYLRSQYLDLQKAILPAPIVGRFQGLSMKRKIDLNTTQRFPYYAAPFEECLIHGLYKSYFPNGQLKDSGYSNNGLKTGVWQEYTVDNKTMSRGFYRKGFKRGEWRYYDAAGKFIYLRRYNKFGKEKEMIEPGRMNAK